MSFRHLYSTSDYKSSKYCSLAMVAIMLSINALNNTMQKDVVFFLKKVVRLQK